MKKHLLTLLATLAFLGAIAQDGEIIYTDFNPDLVHEFFQTDPSHTNVLQTDMDGDSVYDFEFYTAFNHPTCCTEELHIHVNLYDPMFSRRAWGCRFGDTIATLPLACGWGYGYNWWDTIPFVKYVGLRFEKDSTYYYGWVELNILWLGGAVCVDPVYPKLTVTSMAYCTVPNYPLRAGQTSFDWTTMENTASGFAKVYPVPITNTVTVSGHELHQAEIYNTLGQHIVTQLADSDRIIINLSGLPAGIYFVNITDNNGKRCVKKVVKQ